MNELSHCLYLNLKFTLNQLLFCYPAPHLKSLELKIILKKLIIKIALSYAIIKHTRGQMTCFNQFHQQTAKIVLLNSVPNLKSLLLKKRKSKKIQFVVQSLKLIFNMCISHTIKCVCILFTNFGYTITVYNINSNHTFFKL